VEDVKTAYLRNRRLPNSGHGRVGAVQLHRRGDAALPCHRLLEQISQESSEEEYRDQAKRTLNQFALLEGLLVRLSTTLDQGLEHVDLAQTATSQAATLVKGR
jgi:hypothetical protein